MDTNPRSPSTTTGIAALVVGFQALLGVITGVALFFIGRHHAWLLLHPGLLHARVGLALLVLLVSVLLGLMAIGIAGLENWARVGVIVFECLLVLGALAGFVGHPLAAGLAIALAGVVIALVLFDGAWDSGEPGLSAGGSPSRQPM